jgi:putative methionine-R-sulfoxide reductase with GAF domain
MNEPERAQVLDVQRQRWRQGERVPVEALVHEQALAGASEVVLDLIYNEIMLREQDGDRPQLEEYVQRFPELASELAVQFEVDRALDAPLASAAPGATVPDLTPVPDVLSAAKGSPFPPLPGYEILQVLGRGGMGVVYQARQIGLNRMVAVKMILAGVHAGPHELARFRTEAEAVARLQHPNIVQVYEIGAQDGRPFMALELVEGSVAAHLGGTPLAAPQAARWLETLARAAHYAHQRGIVHRDLKPANVLLSRDGVLKIADFGMAKIIAGNAEGQTQTGSIIGTPSYMAPEQAEGRTREMGPATDVYGLGAILYELLTGRPPFQASSVHETLDQVRRQEPVPPRRLMPKVPRDLETICLRCLHKEPDRRYASAQALAEDLTAFLAGEPIRSRRAGRTERLVRWARRRPAEAVLLATGLMAVIGLGVGMVWSHALAVAAVAGLSLLVGSWWYSARLKRALHGAQLQQAAAERSAARLHLLLDMTRRLLRTTQLEDLLRLLTETTVWLANAESATIYLVDRAKSELWSEVTMGTQVGEIRLPLGVGIAGTVAVTGEPVNVTDPYADPRFHPSIDRRTGRRTRNLLTVPMTGQDGRILGVFQVVNKKGGPFGVDDLEILSALAASASIAIEHALSSRPGVEKQTGA